MGDALDFLEKLEAEGEHVEELENKPEIEPENIWLWNAFANLHNQRQCGFSVNPLSFQDIMKYIEFKGYRGEEADFLYEVITKVDSEWLRKKQKENDGN